MLNEVVELDYHLYLQKHDIESQRIFPIWYPLVN